MLSIYKKTDVYKKCKMCIKKVDIKTYTTSVTKYRTFLPFKLPLYKRLPFRIGTTI